MFTGFKGDLISFYADIRFNNNRQFMDAHRQEYYQKVRDPFYAFIDALAPVMRAIEPDMETRPVKCLSRINRDTRFTKDKSPYRDHHWVAWRLAAIPKEGMPFYWFEIRVESVSWGLGTWGENRRLLDALRRRVAAKPQEVLPLLEMAQRQGFRQGGSLWQRIKAPDGLPPALAALYRARELYFERADINPAVVFNPALADIVAADFTALAPLWRLLRGLTDIGEGEA